MDFLLCSYRLMNVGEPVGGKRQRKPNRRYIEDENEAVPGSAPPANGIRSATGETGGNALGLSTRLSWRTVETDGPADMIGRHGTLRGSTLRNATRANLSQIQRAKPLLGGLVSTMLFVIEIQTYNCWEPAPG